MDELTMAQIDELAESLAAEDMADGETATVGEVE